MVQPSMSEGRRELISVTPLLLGTILLAVVATMVLVVTWYLDMAGGGGGINRTNLIVAVGLATTAWAAVVFAICRDVIITRIDRLGEQVVRAHTEMLDHVVRTSRDIADEAFERGLLSGMRMAEAERDGPGPGGGKVLRHPRLSEPHDRSDRPRAQ